MDNKWSVVFFYINFNNEVMQYKSWNGQLLGAFGLL